MKLQNQNILVVKTIERSLIHRILLFSLQIECLPLGIIGEPTDRSGNDDKRGFRRVLESERQPIDKIYSVIVACTDDEDTMQYLNGELD